MSISTTSSPEEKREKIKKLREYHQPTFEKMGVPDALYIPKLAYKPPGKIEMHIGFFPSEVSKGEDIYTEFAERDYSLQETERKLYKWRYNAHFDEEYSKSDPAGTTGHVRYLVPVGELVVVSEKEVIQKTDLKIPDPETDLPMDQMTMRDYAAIHLKKAVSRKEWLNEIIKSA